MIIKLDGKVEITSQESEDYKIVYNIRNKDQIISTKRRSDVVKIAKEMLERD